jgi:hypothetical protein
MIQTAKRYQIIAHAVSAQKPANPGPRDAVMAYLQGVEMLAITTAAATQACLLVANAKMASSSPAVQVEQTQTAPVSSHYWLQSSWQEPFMQKEPMSSVQGFAVVIAIMCNICIRWFSR